MPVFEYVALNNKGKQVKGSIDSDTLRTARQRLRAQGIFPTDIKETKVSAGVESRFKDLRKILQGDRIGLNTLAGMTRQLATLVGSGIPLVGALQALSEQTESPVLRRIVIDVRERVEGGQSFAKSIQTYPKAFPRLYVNMVASGEASGTLDTVMENLAEYLEAQIALRRKVSSALFYPALMLVFCVLVVIALLTFVVPSIVEIFSKQGALLPLPTRILIGVSDLLLGYWHLLLLLVAASLYGVRWYYGTPNGRERMDRVMLRLPLFGSLYRKIFTARVSGTLSTLLAGGVGLLEALEIVKNIVGNVHVSRAIEEARDGVREGRSLAKELSRSGLFPSLLPQMVAVGEKSGKLEGMLNRASKSYENEVNAALAGLTSLIEPLMIIGLGGIVLSIVIAIMLPMLDLINIVQR